LPFKVKVQMTNYSIAIRLVMSEWTINLELSAWNGTLQMLVGEHGLQSRKSTALVFPVCTHETENKKTRVLT
jgi:hypothetical protein